MNVAVWYIRINLLVYSRKMNKKSAKIIDSYLRNVTKALHDPKRDIFLKCEFTSKQWNVPQHDTQSKCVFASKQWNAQKWNKESSKSDGYPLIKV